MDRLEINFQMNSMLLKRARSDCGTLGLLVWYGSDSDPFQIVTRRYYIYLVGEQPLRLKQAASSASLVAETPVRRLAEPPTGIPFPSTFLRDGHDRNVFCSVGTIDNGVTP